MTLISILVLAALILLFFEVILPGGILGLLAVGCVVTATILGYIQYGALAGLSIFIGSVLAVSILVFVQFKFMAKSYIGRKFFLNKSISGRTNESSSDTGKAKELIGQQGITLTRLNPTGKISIDGESYEAFCQDGYLEAKEKITVVAKENFKLIIKKL